MIDQQARRLFVCGTESHDVPVTRLWREQGHSIGNGHGERSGGADPKVRPFARDLTALPGGAMDMNCVICGGVAQHWGNPDGGLSVDCVNCSRYDISELVLKDQARKKLHF